MKKNKVYLVALEDAKGDIGWLKVFYDEKIAVSVYDALLYLRPQMPLPPVYFRTINLYDKEND